MSRSGYSDDIDNWNLIRWRGQVASAIRGKRGQKLLRDLLAALDAMPEKRLIADELVDGCGVCALGALGQARGMDLSKLDPENASEVATMFDIAKPLAKEIVFENDEAFYFNETPEHRWTRMRAWVARHIIEPKAGDA
jgi:hypothetical protein